MSHMKDDHHSSQAVLVLGHGSRRGRATDEGIREIARRLQARFPAGPPVGPAFFEFLSPTLAQAVRSAAEQGAVDIAILPYFLFDGKEIQHDIPAELDHLRTELPTVNIRQMPNLGLDPRMAKLVARRVRDALDGTSQYLPAHGLVRRHAQGRLGVIVVNRGSKPRWDPGTRLDALGDLVRHELGGDTLVATAQAENSPRTIEIAAATLAAQGARRIVVAPYLHFVGKVLSRNVIPALERSRAAHPEVQLCLAWTLCVDDTAIDILQDRVRETGFQGTGPSSAGPIEQTIAEESYNGRSPVCE
jgi:sirohydrochlorin ferrochelatase